MRDQTITNEAVWMWIGFFIAVLANGFVFIIWKVLPDIFQEHPIDHYLGSHRHCKRLVCEKAPNPLRPLKRCRS